MDGSGIVASIVNGAEEAVQFIASTVYVNKDETITFEPWKQCSGAVTQYSVAMVTKKVGYRRVNIPYIL